MHKPKTTMTSLEAAALILSEGKTTDVEQAELMSEGKLLDPDALTRAHFRRMLGFDFSITVDEERHKIIARDDERGYKTSATWVKDDDAGNSRRMAKAAMRLKKLHDDHLEQS